MRNGTNPGKVEHVLPPFKRHRVLIPVHIPDHNAYFEHALEILRLCLESLVNTSAGRVSVTVISNGSVPEITPLLMSYARAGRIDQLVLNDHNWGKIDAVLAALHGRFEELLTVSDADVLFLPGWVDAVEKVFAAFPEAGVVTPVPNPATTYLHTTSTIFSALLTRELHMDSVVPQRDLDLFAESMGSPEYFRPEHRASQLLVSRGGTTACVGGGHFVFTMRGAVVDCLPHEPVLAPLGPAGMASRFDDPPDAMGAWRLSTTRAYARHMGNVPEPWMYEELAQLTATDLGVDPTDPLPPFRPSSLRHIPLRWRRRGLAILIRYLWTSRQVRAARVAKPAAANPGGSETV